MSAHTPGPWTLGGVRKDSNFSKTFTGIVTTPYGNVVRTYPVSSGSRGEAEANGTLIAAAPDLLKAAQDLLDKLEFLNGCNEHDMDGPEELPEFTAIRAAIAKAQSCT